MSTPVLPAAPVPPDISRLLEERSRRWNNPTTIAQLYTEDAFLHDTRVAAWHRGRTDVGSFIVNRFRAGYRITPVSYSVDRGRGYLAGYLTRDSLHIGHVHLSLQKAADGAWQIAAETISFPGPSESETRTAEQLVRELDAAGIQRAVVLSVAYWFGSPLRPPVTDEYAKVRAENDWVAEQVARHSDRLVGFCSFNPLKEYALGELERCARNPHLRGLKLHFGNSSVDIRRPDHREQVRQVFRAANRLRLPIVAHLWTNGSYEAEGGEHAKVFLDELLPEVPEVTVQIAHMAGGGRPNAPAMGVFADAIARGDPRTKNVYFDLTTVVDVNSPVSALEANTLRMRQIGLDRMLWGSDLAAPGAATRVQWGVFRGLMPLSDDELRTIADNVAPYLR